jgi:phospholipase C
VVVMVFENRSFDNLLGRLYEPGEVRSFEGVLGRRSWRWARSSAAPCRIPFTKHQER